jgi:Mce-associated membrane protein
LTVDTDRDTSAPEEADADSIADPEVLDDVNNSDDLGGVLDADQSEVVGPKRRRLWTPKSPQRQAVIAVVLIIAALAGIASWQGQQVYQSHRLSQDHAALLQAGRQGALNLTTIDWQHADADVKRILDSATGTFYDDFSKRSKPFVDVVKQAQSTSVGTISAAGLESATANDAQVLVAVSVKITNSAGPEQKPRSWRMRISVQKIGDEAKVSNVEFVP